MNSIEQTMPEHQTAAAATSRFITANGIKLHLREWGHGQQPTVVLVHGYPDSSHVWDATAALLAAHFHVVAYDVRGAGQSDAPARVRDYALSELARDFAAVIDSVSPDTPVHVVAHDWGSIQSWEPVTDPAMAARIASFTSISGPCLDHVGEWARQRVKSGRPASLGQVAGQLLHSWYIAAFQIPGIAPTLWNRGLDRYWPRLQQRLEGMATPHTNPSQRKDGAVGIRLYRANMLQRLSAPRQRHTRVPVQLLVPRNDPFVTPELLDDLHRWTDRLWREEVDAGHWLPVSHPEWVASRVQRFVQFIASGQADNAAPPALARRRVSGPRKPLTGKLAVVTGAGNGIGRQTLLTLAQAGADVIGTDINADALEDTLAQAREQGVSARGQVMDVSQSAQWDDLVASTAAREGTPDILVNNAGIGMAGRFLDTQEQDWERILGVNLWSVIHGSRRWGQMMRDAHNGGVIVNVASAAAFAPSRTMSAYSTTKAAVRMLTDCIRAELADAGIQVISVCPGVINTGITDRSRFVGEDAQGEQTKRARASALYARRNLGPEAVAHGILDAILNHRDEVLVGAEAHGMNWLGRFTPGLARRLAQFDLAG